MISDDDFSHRLMASPPSAVHACARQRHVHRLLRESSCLPRLAPRDPSSSALQS